MKKTVLYRYVGTNGVIVTPIHLEDMYYTRMIRLTPDAGKILSDGNVQVKSITVPEEEVSEWHEENIVVNSK